MLKISKLYFKRSCKHCNNCILCSIPVVSEQIKAQISKQMKVIHRGHPCPGRASETQMRHNQVFRWGEGRWREDPWENKVSSSVLLCWNQSPTIVFVSAGTSVHVDLWRPSCVFDSSSGEPRPAARPRGEPIDRIPSLRWLCECQRWFCFAMTTARHGSSNWPGFRSQYPLNAVASWIRSEAVVFLQNQTWWLLP